MCYAESDSAFMKSNKQFKILREKFHTEKKKSSLKTRSAKNSLTLLNYNHLYN